MTNHNIPARRVLRAGIIISTYTIQCNIYPPNIFYYRITYFAYTIQCKIYIPQYFHSRITALAYTIQRKIFKS